MYSTDKSNAAIQTRMEEIWSKTCGSWQNCTENTIEAFLTQCDNQNIDPQFCMNWISQHKEKIPNWSAVSEISLDWIQEHTSTGSPITDINS